MKIVVIESATYTSHTQSVYFTNDEADRVERKPIQKTISSGGDVLPVRSNSSKI